MNQHMTEGYIFLSSDIIDLVLFNCTRASFLCTVICIFCRISFVTFSYLVFIY